MIMKKKIGFLVATTLAVGLSVIGVSAFGNDKLNEKAFSDAGVNQAEVRDVESELDVENGKKVYEVEFESNGREYDYDIDADTGEILKSEKESDDDVAKKQQSAKATEKAEVKKETKTEKKAEVKKETKAETNKKADTAVATDIGEAKAKAIALKNAGVSEGETTRLRVERDYDDGRVEYNVEFRVGNKEYEYEIDAKTGKILDQDIDLDDHDDDRYDNDDDDRYDDDDDDRWDD